MSSQASPRCAEAAGNLASSACTTWACWAPTEAVPNCLEMGL